MPYEQDETGQWWYICKTKNPYIPSGLVREKAFSTQCNKCGKTLLRRVADKRTHTRPCISCGLKIRNQYISSNQFPGWKGCGAIPKRIFSGIRLRAKKRGIDFNITIEQAANLFKEQQGKCALTGLEIVLRPQREREATTASLDRIDSSKGYRIGNIQWVHKWVNLMKWDFTQNEFITLCKEVAEHNKDK